MKNNYSNNFLKANLFIKEWLVLGFIICAVQASFAQDFDFQQQDDDNFLVVMEAENFSSNTPKGDVTWSPTDSPEGFSGEGAMMAVTGSAFATAASALESSAVLTYVINFETMGPHYIWARASRTGGSDDSYHAGVNGAIPESGEFLTFHGTDFEAGTWGWIFIRNTIEPAYVNIPSTGVHELNLYIRENNFRLDKIILTPSDTSQFKPDSLGPEETLPAASILPVNRKKDVMSVYPNMADKQITVSLKDNNYSYGVLKIIDLQGKLIETEILEGNIRKVINIAHLASGVYLIQLEQNGEIISANKILKY